MVFRSFWHTERVGRQFAEAGVRLVHIYPAKGGRRTFALPRAARVVELFSGRTVADKPTKRFTTISIPDRSPADKSTDWSTLKPLSGV